jgi:hypothetical protein
LMWNLCPLFWFPDLSALAWDFRRFRGETILTNIYFWNETVIYKLPALTLWRLLLRVY